MASSTMELPVNAPKVLVNRTPHDVRRHPYEPQRRRLDWIEDMEAARLRAPVPVVRLSVARRLQLTLNQVRDIRRGRPKDLYGDIRDRIDRAFIQAARRQIKELHDELAMAQADAGGLDPDVVAKTKLEIDAVARLILESKAANAQEETSW